MSTEFRVKTFKGYENMPMVDIVETDGPGWVCEVYSPVYGRLDVSVYLVDHDYGAYELLLDYGDVEPISVTLAPLDTLKTGIELGLEEMGKDV